MILVEQMIKRLGWSVVEKEDYVMIYPSGEYIDQEQVIFCTNDGAFKNNRGKKQFLFNFDIKDKNLFAVYLYISNEVKLNNLLEEKKESIQNSNNIINDLLPFFTETYLKEKLNLDVNNIKNDALNVVMDHGFYDLIYVKGNYSTILSGASSLKGIFYSIFKHLVYKVRFDEIIKQNKLEFSELELLKLFQIYANKINDIPQQITNDQKKTL